MFFRRILCVLLLALAGSAKGQQQVASIVTVVVNSTNHTTLELLVTRADLATVLSAPGETLTLFAPTDDAFSAWPDSMLKKKVTAYDLAPKWKPLLQDVRTPPHHRLPHPRARACAQAPAVARGNIAHWAVAGHLELEAVWLHAVVIIGNIMWPVSSLDVTSAENPFLPRADLEVPCAPEKIQRLRSARRRNGL